MSSLPPELPEPPDFDTRPNGAVRSTLHEWVDCCPSCGYCAPDLTQSEPVVRELLGSASYRALLEDESLPVATRRFLCYSCILERVHMFADAGWSALHGAWAADDVNAGGAAARARLRAIEAWQRGKGVGQLFSDDMATEFALVTDLYRRTGDFERATVACAEGLDLEDVPPAIEIMLRRQLVLIQRRDTGCHSMKELLHPTAAT